MEYLELPGLIDAHVHLREPGATHKEDALSGTIAALAGGFVAVLDMPNNQPPILDLAALEAKAALFGSKAVADFGLFVGYVGGPVDAVVQAAGRAVGLKLYLDETFGHLTLSGEEALAPIFEAWPAERPIAIHGESRSIALALNLGKRYGQRLHICHVPDPDDLLRIDAARQRGDAVTCEVTPHHLFLSSRDGPRLGSYGQMKPPLCTPAQVELFWERLALVDAIASDHAPHTRAEKESSAPPPGVPGLETTLPLLLHAVHVGRLSLERLVELLHHNPFRIYGLQPPDESGVTVALGEPYLLSDHGYRTRCGWSPFGGLPALGRVERVTLRGDIVWERGVRLAHPGQGRELQRVV
ncbi:MAG: amidohydrolase family protein [Anaerolineae bacterium]|nr:amidohydrolase family protein [Anaerolineae bacterium]